MAKRWWRLLVAVIAGDPHRWPQLRRELAVMMTDVKTRMAGDRRAGDRECERRAVLKLVLGTFHGRSNCRHDPDNPGHSLRRVKMRSQHQRASIDGGWCWSGA
jgi:hypothetical protein